MSTVPTTTVGRAGSTRHRPSSARPPRSTPSPTGRGPRNAAPASNARASSGAAPIRSIHPRMASAAWSTSARRSTMYTTRRGKAGLTSRASSATSTHIVLPSPVGIASAAGTRPATNSIYRRRCHGYGSCPVTARKWGMGGSSLDRSFIVGTPPTSRRRMRDELPFPPPRAGGSALRSRRFPLRPYFGVRVTGLGVEMSFRTS